MQVHETKPRPTPARRVTPICYSVEEGAIAIGISRTLMFQLIRDKKIAAVRIGRRTLVPVRECEAYLLRLLKQDHPSMVSANGPKVGGHPEDAK